MNFSLIMILMMSLFCLNAWTNENPFLYIDDLSLLNQMEMEGYSVGHWLGEKTSTNKAHLLYKNNSLFQSMVHIIAKPLETEAATDQWPLSIPDNYGDLPTLIKSLRGFEDRGARSKNDLKNGFIIQRIANNSQFPYKVEQDGDEPRHFDPRWLQSEWGYFKLVGIINRMDRMDYVPNSCGEIRFIYRLYYRSPMTSSSLPFFINIVTTYPKDQCHSIAKNWFVTKEDFTKDSKLRQKILNNLRFLQLEINYQTLRFTSGYMHDFGGQALYIQRVFRQQENELRPVPLENTPAVTFIDANPKLLTDFVEFLAKDNNLQKLDQGTLVIDFNPDFLSPISLSWSTLGRSRLANKPYTYLFRDKMDLLKKLDLSKLNFIKSPQGILERLNNLTCMGCHQAGGTAGFHFLGMPDPSFSHPFNQQALSGSAHFLSELSRRNQYLIDLKNRKTPNSFRPLSYFGGAKWDLNSKDLGVKSSSHSPIYNPLYRGQLCLINNSDFKTKPSCAPNLECLETVKTTNSQIGIGECVRSGASRAGDLCWIGALNEKSTPAMTQNPPVPYPLNAFNIYAFQDKLSITSGRPLAAGYNCLLPQSGAPLGRNSRPCTLEEENFQGDLYQEPSKLEEVCANQGGNGFDLCAASGNAGQCLEERVVRSMLDTCSYDHPCREDYICQQFPNYDKVSKIHYTTKKNGKPVNLSVPEKINSSALRKLQEAHIGFCVPTYFLFNMRLDGHPNPVSGMPPGAPTKNSKLPLRGYK